ncbi:hypothetical protein [Mycobacterium antarcticum]|uniref:hypothetical protein n=1 Tax=unclassified Mycolicibacterium TaxID=2636767 RepID=UPI0024E0BBDD|nr:MULTISPECIES: hypothetical protein [unclassified Mycolicibacterium]
MLWLGMVVAISFLEAPIKFRAPGVTLPVGLGIGRLVFKALNGVEIALLLVLLVACYVARPEQPAPVLLASVAVVLVIQVVVVRPPLNRRTDRVLAGAVLPRSRMHWAYIALELAKVAVLTALAVALTAGALAWAP